MRLPPVEYKGQRILTTEQLATVYQTGVDNIRVNFKNHKHRFVEGKHYYFLEGDALREFKHCVNDVNAVDIHTRNLYLWTERGANRHCKILDTDKAWEQFENLEETYFRVKDNKAPAPLPASCSMSLSGLASYIHEIRKTMESCYVSPFVIAATVKSICDSCGVVSFDPIPVPPHYEQLSLFTTPFRYEE